MEYLWPAVTQQWPMETSWNILVRHTGTSIQWMQNGIWNWEEGFSDKSENGRGRNRQTIWNRIQWLSKIGFQHRCCGFSRDGHPCSYVVRVTLGDRQQQQPGTIEMLWQTTTGLDNAQILQRHGICGCGQGLATDSHRPGSTCISCGSPTCLGSQCQRDPRALDKTGSKFPPQIPANINGQKHVMFWIFLPVRVEHLRP